MSLNSIFIRKTFPVQSRRLLSIKNILVNGVFTLFIVLFNVVSAKCAISWPNDFPSRNYFDPETKPQPDKIIFKLTTSKLKKSHSDSAKILLAHAIIVKTSPAQSGVAPGNISKVDVWYDAGIRDSLAALAVVSASGDRVDKKDAAIDSSDPAHVSVSVNHMAPGKYTVRYRALSADGHMVSGAWEFDVQP